MPPSYVSTDKLTNHSAPQLLTQLNLVRKITHLIEVLSGLSEIICTYRVTQNPPLISIQWPLIIILLLWLPTLKCTYIIVTALLLLHCWGLAMPNTSLEAGIQCWRRYRTCLKRTQVQIPPHRLWRRPSKTPGALPYYPCQPHIHIPVQQIIHNM